MNLYLIGFLLGAISLVFVSQASLSYGLSSDNYNPPLKQIIQGTLPEQVLCTDSTPILIIKYSEKSSACVTLQTAEKLVEREWGSLPENQNIVCSIGSEKIDESKFEDGMLENIQNLLNANVTREYSVQLSVYEQNKSEVEKLLSQCHNVTDMFSENRFSFVNANVSLAEIPKLSFYDEITKIRQAELYELPVILSLVDGKTWIQIDPIQCGGNPWQQDWLENNENNVSEMTNLNEFDLIQDYFKKQGIQIHDLKKAITYGMTCEGCNCARGDTMYLLVDSQNVKELKGFGFKISNMDSTTELSNYSLTDSQKGNFEIMYSLEGSDLVDMIAYSDANSLVINMDNSSGGILTIHLPRDLVDAIIAENIDDAFFVLVDGEEVDYEETPQKTKRILEIKFLKDATQIEIIGTGWI